MNLFTDMLTLYSWEKKTFFMEDPCWSECMCSIELKELPCGKSDMYTLEHFWPIGYAIWNVIKPIVYFITYIFMMNIMNFKDMENATNFITFRCTPFRERSLLLVLHIHHFKWNMYYANIYPMKSIYDDYNYGYFHLQKEDGH